MGSLLTAAALFVGTATSFAAAPTLDYLYPAGTARGTTNTLTVSGKFDPWPPKVWVDASNITFEALTNKGKFEVTVAAGAKAGATLVRLYNDEGSSEPRIFIVGDGREIADRETNNHFAKPQWLGELPVTINGRLDKNGDVDSFGVSLRAGQWLDAGVESHRLMSKVDAVLRLVTTNGQQLAWNHDFTTLDPRIVWRSPVEQTVVLQIFGFVYPASSEVQLTGGEGAIYRLHVATDANPPANAWSSPAEKEPNDTRDKAASFELPASILGTIGSAEDEDRFVFRAAKDEFIEARLEAALLGSSLDAWLKIEDTSGKELARSDDTDGSRDPRLEWKAPACESFVLAVGSVTHRGGESFGYRLTAQRAAPAYKASLLASSVLLSPGLTNEVKLAVTRVRGFSNELVAGFRDLPCGVTGTSTNVPSKSKDVSLHMIAETNAPAFNGPIRVVLADSITEEERPVPVRFVSRGEDNGVPTGYGNLLVESTDRFWLTVRTNSPSSNKSGDKK